MTDGRLPYSLHCKSLQCSQVLDAKVTTLETIRTSTARAHDYPGPPFLECPSLLSVQCRVIKALQVRLGS